MVWPFGFEPLAYAVNTISWVRAGLLLLAAVIVLATLKSGLVWRSLLTRVPFTLFVLLFAYLAVVIFSAQVGTPRFTFWQVIPSAVVMGSTTALAFLGWVYVQEEKPIDPIFTLIAFVFFATLLSVFFSLVFGVMPRLIDWR